MKTRYIYLISLIFLVACTSQPIQPVSTPLFTASPTATSSPIPSSTPTPTPTLTPLPTEIGGGAGQLIFTYERAGFIQQFPDLKGNSNIFTSNVDGTNLTPITNGLTGYNTIQDVSPDGQKVLITSAVGVWSDNPTYDLYLINLDSPSAEPIKLVEKGIKSRSWTFPLARFVDDAQIVYTGKGPQGYGIYVMDLENLDRKRISLGQAGPYSIIAVDAKRVYWTTELTQMTFKDMNGFKYSYGGVFVSLWYSNLDGSEEGKLEFDGRQIIAAFYELAISPDGKMIAWVSADEQHYCGLPLPTVILTYEDSINYNSKCYVMYAAPLANLDNPIKVPLVFPSLGEAGNDYVDDPSIDYLKFFPDNSKVLIKDSNKGFYYAELTEGEHKLTFTYEDPSALDGLKNTSIQDFSPDGKLLMFIDYDKKPYIGILDLDTLTISDEFDSTLDLKDPNYLRPIYWMP